jgi:hypothetical protein
VEGEVNADLTENYPRGNTTAGGRCYGGLEGVVVPWVARERKRLPLRGVIDAGCLRRPFTIATAVASTVGRREAEDGSYTAELERIDAKYRLNGCSLRAMWGDHGRLAWPPHEKG